MASSATVGVSATFSDSATGLAVTSTGSAVLTLTAGLAISDIALPASTAALQLAFPVGVSTAKVVFIRALSPADLTVQVSTASGASVLAIPAGAAMVFYNVTSLFVNTVAGGTIQFGVGS